MKNHKSLYQNKTKVKKYWEISTKELMKEGNYSSIIQKMVFDHTWITTTKAFLEQGEINTGDRILDVGCGWGRIISGIKYFIPDTEIIGVDMNMERLDKARELLDEMILGENVELRVGDADNLPFEDNYFDVVVSARLLQYVSNPVNTVKEFSRVLKPGGRLVLSVPNKFNPIRFFTYSRVLYPPKTVKNWFVVNGLSDIMCRTIGFLPTYKRFHWQSKLLFVEKLQNVPIVDLMGGLVLCSGKKPVNC